MELVKDKKNNAEIVLKRKCKLCEGLFTPTREWAKFCCKEHQKAYWKRVQNDKVYLLKRIEKLEEEIGIK